MSSDFTELNEGYTSLQLFENEGMAKIIDLGSCDPSNTEVAIDRGSNVSDQERIASFGDEEGSVLGLGTIFDITLDRGLGSFIEGNSSGIVALEGAYFEITLFESNILELDTCEFANPKACLEKEFDDCIHSNIIAGSIPKSAIL